MKKKLKHALTIRIYITKDIEELKKVVTKKNIRIISKTIFGIGLGLATMFVPIRKETVQIPIRGEYLTYVTGKDAISTEFYGPKITEKSSVSNINLDMENHLNIEENLVIYSESYKQDNIDLRNKLVFDINNITLNELLNMVNNIEDIKIEEIEKHMTLLSNTIIEVKTEDKKEMYATAVKIDYDNLEFIERELFIDSTSEQMTTLFLLLILDMLAIIGMSVGWSPYNYEDKFVEEYKRIKKELKNK